MAVRLMRSQRRCIFKMTHLLATRSWTSDNKTQLIYLHKEIDAKLNGIHTNDKDIVDELKAIQGAINLNKDLYEQTDDTLSWKEQSDCIEELEEIKEKLIHAEYSSLLNEPIDKLPCYIWIVSDTGRSVHNSADYFSQELCKMYINYVIASNGNAEVVYRKREDNSIREYIIKCDMQNAYGLFKHDVGYHKKQCTVGKNEKWLAGYHKKDTISLLKSYAMVKIIPRYEWIEQYGNVEKYASDIAVFIENEGAEAYKSVHKASNIRFINDIRDIQCSHQKQKEWAKEILICKLIEKTMNIKFDEVREYTKRKGQNRVINVFSKFEIKNGYDTVLMDGYKPHMDQLLYDYLTFFGKLPAKPFETY
eukprot:208783_1